MSTSPNGSPAASITIEYRVWPTFYVKNAQCSIYNERRTCLFLVGFFTSQISNFILKSLNRRANSGNIYKNLHRQLLICLWCQISVIIQSNIGYFHCSNLIFDQNNLRSKQCYWLDKWYFTIFNNHPIKFFGKLIIMYDNNPTIWD